jgi:antirestriction protein
MYRICIQNIGDYNAGKLNFKWLTLPMPTDEFDAALASLSRPDAEEIEVADVEGFGEFRTADCISAWNDAAEWLENFHEPDAFLYWLGNVVCKPHLPEDLAQHEEDFSCAFGGEHSSPEDFVYERVKSCSEIPSHLEHYIDWNMMARDWESDGYHFTKNPSGNYWAFEE